MNQRLHVRYDAQYLYAGRVSFAPHFLRLFPRSDPSRLVRRLELSTNAGADVQYRRDAFDNNVARVFLPEGGSALQFSLECELELRSENAFHFLLEPHAAEFPFTYQETERRRLASYLAPLPEAESAPALAFWEPATAAGPMVPFLVSLIGALHRGIAYEVRPEGEAFTPLETVVRGRGACRDTARLLRALLHQLGFAARLVSGYLWEPRATTAAEERRADGAFHAWTEVFLPGAGWLGLDATNGVFCDHHFIPCAAGLTPEDITPVLGRFFSSTPMTSTMQSTLRIEEIQN